MLGIFAALMLISQLGVVIADFWRPHWLKYLAGIGILLLVLHFLFDNEPFYPRMVPLYLLVGFSFAGTVPMLLHPQIKPKPRTLRILGIVSLVWLLLAAALPLWLLPFYPPEHASGPYKVTSRTFSLASGKVEAGSGRIIELEVWLPAQSVQAGATNTTKDRYPLVFIEPGNLANRHTNEALAQELASYGVAVVSLDHPGQSVLSLNSSGGLALPQKSYFEEAVAISSGLLAPADEARLSLPWQQQRLEDLETALQSIDDLALSERTALGDLVDRSQTAFIGYGLGAGVADAMCRQVDCRALVLADGNMANLASFGSELAAPIQDVALLAISAGYSRNAAIALPMWQDPVLGGVDTQWAVAVNGAGAQGITGLVLQAPIIAQLLDGYGMPECKPLSAVNRCIATFVRRALLYGVSTEQVTNACSVEPLSLLEKQ